MTTNDDRAEADLVLRAMSRASCVFVEDALRLRNVRAVFLYAEGEVALTTHAIGNWHEHGIGATLHAALADLDARIADNPPPKETGG